MCEKFFVIERDDEKEANNKDKEETSKERKGEPIPCVLLLLSSWKLEMKERKERKNTISIEEEKKAGKK